MEQLRKQLSGLLTTTSLLPLLMGLHLFHYRVDRARRAARQGDRGAISIELALAVIALVALASGVVIALKALGDKVTSQIQKDSPIK